MCLSSWTAQFWACWSLLVNFAVSQRRELHQSLLDIIKITAQACASSNHTKDEETIPLSSLKCLTE